MAYYIVREGETATVNVEAGLTTQGSSGTVNNITIPAGYSKIVALEISVGYGHNGTVDLQGGSLIALKGPALKEGEQWFPIGGIGVSSNDMFGDVQQLEPFVIPVSIDINPGQLLELYAMHVGDAFGVSHANVCVVLA